MIEKKALKIVHKRRGTNGVGLQVSVIYIYLFISQSLEPSNGKYLLLGCTNTKIKHI